MKKISTNIKISIVFLVLIGLAYLTNPARDDYYKNNIPINGTITSFKQVYSISKEKGLKWDKRAKCTSIMAKFNSSQDVEMLNAEMIAQCTFRGEKFNNIEDGSLKIYLYYNSNMISEIHGTKGGVLTISPEARDLQGVLNHNIDISDIPELTTNIFGDNWKNDYAECWLRVIVLNDKWWFTMLDNNTGKEISKYIDPYTKQIMD